MKKKCNGNCVDVRRQNAQSEKLFIVQATRALGDGSVKVSYIKWTSKDEKKFLSLSDPKKIPARTYSAASWLKEKVEKFIRPNVVLRIVRKEEVIANG